MQTVISLQSTVVVATDHVSCDLPGEVVILNLANGQYFGLNSVGTRIWQLLQSGRALGEVRDTLIEEYPDVDSERCTTDLLNVLTDLVEAELVRVAA